MYKNKVLYVLLIENEVTELNPTHKFYKIGETEEGREPERYREISNGSIKTKFTPILPNGLSLTSLINPKYRINDKKFTSKLIEYHPDIIKIESEKVKNTLKIIDGKDEIFCIPNSYNVEKLIKEEFKYFYNHPEEYTLINKVGKIKEIDEEDKLPLTERVGYEINGNKFYKYNYLLDIIINKLTSNSSILVEGTFPIYVMYRIVETGAKITYLIDTDNEEYFKRLPSANNLNIIIKTNIKDIKEYFKNMGNFDYIIMNPPYNVANEIIDKSLEVCKEMIVLAPLKNYKKNGLYRFVQNFNLVDSSIFEDATITNNLNIAYLTHKKGPYKSEEELKLSSYNQNYIDFYSLNLKCKHYAIDKFIMWYKASSVTPKPTYFLITSRSVLDGVHKTPDCYDYKWNILKNISNNDLYINTRDVYTCGFIEFNTEIEHQNFCNFWYENPLMNDLIKGLRDTGGTSKPALPKLNWSKPRDYANLTYEELLQALREDNEID